MCILHSKISCTEIVSFVCPLPYTVRVRAASVASAAAAAAMLLLLVALIARDVISQLLPFQANVRSFVSRDSSLIL